MLNIACNAICNIKIQIRVALLDKVKIKMH